VFSSLLNKYLTSYLTTDGTEYYGYVDSEIITPTLITHLIDNTNFTSTSGWTSAISAVDAKKATISPELGRWTENKEFVSLIDDWGDGEDNTAIEAERTPCLKFIYGGEGKSNYIINSGFYSNRTLLKTISPKEKFVLRVKIRDAAGTYLNTLDTFRPHL
jgi:hypothetical protein